MAAGSVGSIICVPGVLSFGGTVLGILRDMVFEPHPIYRNVIAEEWGVVSNSIYCGERPIFKGVLRYPDADAMSIIPAAGSFSFNKSGSGAVQAGRAGVLLFTPLAPLAHPGVKLYNAIPMIDEAAALQLSMGEEFGLAVQFAGTPDSSGRVYAVGLVGSLP